MLDRVGFEQVHQEEIGCVLLDNVDGGVGPDLVVASGTALLIEVLDLVAGEGAIGNQFLRDGIVDVGPLAKLPCDAFRSEDGDPVDLRGGEAFFSGGFIHGANGDEFVLVDPGRDGGGAAICRKLDESVRHDVVLAGVDAGDERGVIGPGHRRIDGRHGSGDGTGSNERAQSGHRKAGILQGARGKAVDGDDDHDGLLRCRSLGHERCGRERCDEGDAKGGAQRIEQLLYLSFD